jgi:hypothetical protein
VICKRCRKPGNLLPYYIGLYGRSEIETHAWLHEGCSEDWHNDWRKNGMAFEHKDNTGSLFRNKDRKTDKHPSHTGQGKVFGTEVWISGWVNETSDGSKFFSLKFQPKDEQKPKSREPGEDDDMGDDDIPF